LRAAFPNARARQIGHGPARGVGRRFVLDPRLKGDAMTPDQRAHIRQRIEAMIGELATTIGRLESNTKNVSLELTSIGRL
jgi:hypothetical protein